MRKALILILFILFFVLTPKTIFAQVETKDMCGCSIEVSLKKGVPGRATGEECKISGNFKFEPGGSLIYSSVLSGVPNLPEKISLGNDLAKILDSVVRKCMDQFPGTQSEPGFLEYSEDFLMTVFYSTVDCEGIVGEARLDKTRSTGYADAYKAVGCSLERVYVTTPTTPAQTQVDEGSPFSVPSAASLNKLGTNVPLFIGRLIKTVMGFVGTIALLMFIYGGVLYMTAHGNADRQRKGLDTLIWASLGVLVILSSYALVNFIIGAFS